MTQKQINRLNAAISTTGFCDASAAETAAITAFATLVLLIKSKIVIVQGFNQLGDTPTKGVTLNTKALRQSMMEHTYRLGNAIFSYAAGLTPPDQDLMAQAKLTKDTLENLSKEACATECDRIHQLAVTLGVLIVPYGASASDITDTGSLVTLYLTSFGDPRAAVVTRSNAKTQANVVLNDIMSNLLEKQLDTMANTLRFTNSSWWNQYRLSREVIDLGSTFTKLRATVTDQNGTVVKGATVSLVQSGIVIRSKNTDLNGKVSISRIKPGDYDIRTEKTGYTTQTEAGVHFAPGSEKIHLITLPATAAIPSDPPGFDIEEFTIPGGGSVIAPIVNEGEPIQPTFQLYLLSTNGTAVVCTTDLPANPCTAGFSLLEGLPFVGAIGTMGLDLTKSNIQFTNPGTNNITVRVGIQE